MLIALDMGCSLVMDSDFGKYEALESGEGGSGGTVGTGGSGGQVTGGTGGDCKPGLTINEIQTQGSNGADDEFVEFYNAGKCAASLDEYVLAYRSAAATADHLTTWTGKKGEVLQPKAFYVIGGVDFKGSADDTFPSGMALSQSGGGIALKWSALMVDKVGWGTATNQFVSGTAAPAPGTEESIARYPDGEGVNDNGADFSVATPTPGAKNPER
jgi:hypothetical protein